MARLNATVDVAAELGRIFDQIGALPAALRQGVVDELWSRIPTDVDESAFSANLGIGVPLSVAPQYSTLELVTSIVACVPTGATGLIQLGSMVLPVSAGTTVICPVRKLLGANDTRALTLAGSAGPAALWLTGEQAPTFGVIGP